MTIGIGEDCFRTWESVLLGSIPIVRKSLLHPLFRSAPVLMMDDLEAPVDRRAFEDYSARTLSKRNVLAQYWFDRITATRDMALRKS